MSGPVKARHGMVASSQQLASKVGVQLLEAGGSAVDAALGTNAMLSLIEPYMCGPGGDLFAQVWDPANSQLFGLNASGQAPAGRSLKTLKDALGEAPVIPPNGHYSLTTPGAARGWQALHERFGRLPLKTIFTPVIAAAKAGVGIGAATAVWWQHAAAAVTDDASMRELDAGLRATYLPDGAAPRAGQRFNNLALGETYRRLAVQGFEDFYSGGLAEQLLEYLEASGAVLDGADLEATKADWVEPISSTYRGYEVFELPPNGQGLSVLQMLNMLEGYPLAEWGPDSSTYWHHFIEAKKLAFEDRARFFADPAFAAIPVVELASKPYARRRAALIGEQANQSPRHGDPSLAHGDTTYLSVADSDGMMVSLIQSIYNGFGSGLVAPALGFALQCRGAGFSLDPGHPNAYAPGKRPFHTIIPAFVMRDGKPLMSIGVMGADMQPQGQVQVLVNHIDFGLDIQTAGELPRMRHDGINHPNRTELADAGIIWFEPGFAESLINQLKTKGHDMREATHPVQHFMGGYQCIQREEDGYSGASEPRFDGQAIGSGQAS